VESTLAKLFEDSSGAHASEVTDDLSSLFRFLNGLRIRFLESVALCRSQLRC
jgi:hypothetical protein